MMRLDVGRRVRPPRTVCSFGRQEHMFEPTRHIIYEGDSRDLSALPDCSLHLVVTSPPYASLKRYEEHPAQLGHIADYDDFLSELDKVWAECFRVLVPGGRVAC